MNRDYVPTLPHHRYAAHPRGNPRTARQMEAAYRTTLAKGEVDIVEAEVAPTFAELATRFVAHVQIRHENKPRTIDFYIEKLSKLLRYTPIDKLRADRVDEGVIEGYGVTRRAFVCPATVNRELATLRADSTPCV